MAIVAGSKKVLIQKGLKKRPDGTDPDQYENLNNSTYRKWAWEFLRRNPKFVEACIKVKAGSEEEKLAIAQEFGLKQFKKYTEGYKGESGYPKFSIGSISSWSNLESDKGKCRLAQIKIGAGQILIRFDLVSAIKDKKALDKQLYLAKQRLAKRVAEYEKVIQKESKVHKHKALNFGIYIRLLDCLDKGKTPLECAKLVFPLKGDGRTNLQLQSDVKDPINAAKKFAEEWYIYLSILPGKPKGKGIPLEL